MIFSQPLPRASQKGARGHYMLRICAECIIVVFGTVVDLNEQDLSMMDPAASKVAMSHPAEMVCVTHTQFTIVATVRL